jgi:HD superfamily phosphodiesterase
MLKSTDPQHCGSHLLRVDKNAVKIVRILKMGKEIDLNLLGATCYLHDLAFIKHKPGLINYVREGKRVKRIVTEFLKDINIPHTEKRIIIKAVWKHTFSFPFRRLNKKEDVYAKILQDADTLDIFSPERLWLLIGSAKKYLYYKTLKIFSKRVSKWGIKHLSFFLNYPEIGKEFNN